MNRFTPSLRSALRIGTAIAALAATPAFAQDAAPNDAAQAAIDADSADIVVTARRREESLQDVPIAVTAFTADKLVKIGAVDLTDIQTVSPNTTLKVSRGTNSTLSAFIRGVGQQDPVPGFEAGIGIYLDDVYLNRPQAAVLDIYDVERIEVLRGPQGTLYGRNTIGGAVKYVTRKLPDDLEIRLKGTYGYYNQLDGIASLSVPIGSMLKVGGSVARLTRDGFGKNLTNGLENYNKDIWAGRGTIEFTSPDERLFVRLTGDYTHDTSSPRNGYRLIPGIVSKLPVLANKFDTRAGLNNPEQDIEAGGLSMSATAKITDALTLRSISAWRKDRSFTPIDFDSNPAIDVDVPAVYRNEQTSQEFQLLYSGDKLNGLVGFYYLGAKAETRFDVLLFTTGAALGLPGLDSFTAGEVKTETSSFYGDFTYDFTPAISLSVGGRYTWDERSSHIFKANFLNGPTRFFGGSGVQLGAAATDFRGKARFKRFTPRASLSFKPAEDHMIYASYSEGFKGGGFDPRGSGTSAPISNASAGRSYQDIYNFLSFDPETVKSYEIGYKGAAFDRRLTWAVAGFHADYTDVQVPGSVACTVNGVASFCGITTNAAKARIDGVEVESNAVLARDFAGAGSSVSLAGTLGYIDARYKSFIGPTGTDVANIRVFQNTPDWTASGTATLNLPISTGVLTGNSTVSYRSLTHQFETASPFLDQPGYTLWDAGLTYAWDNYTVGVYGKNLTDKRYKTSGYQYIKTNLAGTPLDAANRPITNGQGYVGTLGTEGVATAFYGNPRQVFVSLAVKF